MHIITTITTRSGREIDNQLSFASQTLLDGSSAVLNADMFDIHLTNSKTGANIEIMLTLPWSTVDVIYHIPCIGIATFIS